MVITRKIQLIVANEGEQKDEAYKLLRHYHDSIYKINNFIVNNIYLNTIIEDKFLYHDKILKEKIDKADAKIKDLYSKRGKADHKLKSEDDKAQVKKLKDDIKKYDKEIDELKKAKNELIKEKSKEFREQFREVYNINFDSSIGQFIRNEFPDIPDTILSPAISELNFYKKEVWKAKTGQESIKNYKKGMPFNTRGRDLKFFEQDGDIYINWVRSIVFKIHFGRDRSNNREIINRVLDGTYKACDSSISYGNKIILNLCVDIPQRSVELDEDKVMGVDLGFVIPAYISTNTGYFRKSLGSIDEILKFRTQVQNRRKKMQHDVTLARGGHGRKRKLKALNRLRKTERNWIKTYNHKISKAIVDFAIKERCKTINLEFLKGIKDNMSSKFLGRNWTYHELQKFIEYKAEKVGIDVAYIDPYHTSQICSECGNYEEGQRLDQKTFKCKACGFEANADYNASRNIARSTAYVDDIKDCQYYKLKNK